MTSFETGAARVYDSTTRDFISRKHQHFAEILHDYNHTLSLDGDPVDVLVPTPYPLQPGSVIRCRPVGVLKMTDESGEDAKLVAVPHTKLSKEYDHIKDVNDLPELLKAQITHFFEHYKDLEKGKWVKVDGWDNAEAAKAEIISSFERAQKK